MAEEQKTDLPEVENINLNDELVKLEDEINTLKQVLASKETQANELRKKLGIGFGQQIQQKFATIAESDTVKKTSETFAEVGNTIGNAFTGFGAAATTKLGEMKSSPSFQSFEQKTMGLFGRNSQSATPVATSPVSEPAKDEPL